MNFRRSTALCGVMIMTLAWLTVPRHAPAALIPISNIGDLFNTGVDATHTPLADDALDPHYSYTQFAGGPPPLSAAPTVATSTTGFPVAPAGPWLGDNAVSAWVTPAPDTTGNIGNYTYSTTFTLPSGIDLSQVFITGVWASDNDGVDIIINGQSMGIRNTTGFGVYSPQWAIGSGFVTGTNHLDFVVNEASGSAGAGGYTGLRVEMGGQYANPGRVAIPGLKNSGVATPEGAALADDSISPGVTLTGAITGNAIVARGTAGFPIPPWTPDSRDSAWVTPATDTNGPDGDYAYSITFDLTGMDPKSVLIMGRWAVDNSATEILLNGQPTGNTNLATGFADYVPFSISSDEGDIFLPGVNTLTFNVNNGAPPGPTGVRWEFLSATAVLVPEPGAIGLLACGVTSLSVRRRR